MIRLVNTTPRKAPEKTYGKYFLSFTFEAPGDPGEPDTNPVASDAYNPNANTRVINVIPGERTRRLNFDAATPEPLTPDQPDPASMGMSPDVPDQPAIAGGVGDPMVSDASIDSGGGIPDPNGPDTTDYGAVNDTTAAQMPQPQADPNAPGGDPNAPEDPNAIPAPGEDGGPAIDDASAPLNFDDPNVNPDAAAGTDGAMPADPNMGAAGGADPNTPSKGPGIEYDSTRRYNLFKEFMALITTINGYTEKLENILSDDAEQNQAIRIAEDDLTKVKDLTRDYMLLRFDASDYVQSLLFYQSMKTIIQKVLDNLDKAKRKISQMREKENKKNKNKTA